MISRGGSIRRWVSLFAFVAMGLFASVAQANTWADTCAGCHEATANGPPLMPSLDATYGKIMADNGQMDDNCSVTFNCVLRQKLAGKNAGGTIVNATARANMSVYAEGPGASQFSAAELEVVRLYLQKVRDEVVASPSPAFSFPNTLTTSNSSIASTVVISNSRATIVSYTFSLVGTNPGDYAITSGATGSCAASPSATTPTTCNANVTVRFSPTAGGSRPATLRLTFSNAAADPVPFTRNFGLAGNGVVPTPGFNISSNSLTLSARLGSSTTGSLTITNPVAATANLVLSAFNFSAPQYVRSGTSTCAVASSLAPGASCSLVVSFTPTAAGSQNGSLSIVHNAAGSPAPVTLTGSGTQSLISPASQALSFGNVQQGVPKPINQIVSNTGTTTLNFTVSPSAAAARTGPAKDDYAVTGTCTTITPLAALGGTCTLIVTFTPTALGARPATLTISSDATNGPLVITLDGAGVALPEPVVTPPASDFPDTVINETSAQTRTVTIRNDRVRNITYSVSNATDFRIGAESCAGRVVPGGGGTCTIAIQFIPTLGAGEGRRIATLPFAFTGTVPDPDPTTINVDVAGNALLPLAQSATSLNASAVVGSPTTTSMLLTNRSASSITLSTLVFSGAAAGDYSLDATNTCTAALVLVAGNNCTLVVRFNPPAAGTRNATLTISHNAAGSPQTVSFLGAATPAPQGQIQLSATSLTYAATQLGSTSPQTITVQNSGNLALTFSAFTFGGAMPGDFQRSGTCSVAAPLPIAGQCTLILSFAPTALGARTATLTISSDASNGAATVTLAGTGVPVPAPQVSLTPATLDFGTQSVGGLYPTRRARLANSGTADLTVASIAVAGTGFSNASAAACPAVLAPGAGCDIDVAFGAVAAASYTGSLTVVSNAAGSPHSITLSGAGSVAAIPVLAFSPAVSSLDFGTVSAGSVSAVQTVTVQNQGPGGVTLTVLNAIGADATSFSVAGGSCSLAAPLFQGGTCTVDIRFAPGSSGTKTASLQIASTGSFPPVLALTGVGLAGPNPSLELSATALAFDSTRVGAQSLPAAVRLSSSGSGVVTVSAMQVTGSYAIQSTTCPPLPFSLPAGTECTISVSFAPVAQGASAGTLSITSDAAPTVREVSLSGSGDPSADVGGGGCTLGDGTSPNDPALWMMVLLAALCIVRRRRYRLARKEPLN
ncbi:MAG: choice-of-anchor D domain-containing protein [Caldimonas sp.]